MKVRRRLASTLIITLYSIVSLIILLPLLDMFQNSLMSTSEMARTYSAAADGYIQLKIIPERPSFEQYYAALVADPEFFYYFWNTVILVLPILLGTVVFSTLGAYGLTKFRFPGRQTIFLIFMLLVLLPYQVILPPQYILLRETGLLGSRLSVILPLLCAPLGVFLLSGFIRNIPDETFESARLEGAREVQVFLHITVPQALPGIVLLIMFTLVANWNMVEQPLVFLSDQSKYPLSIAMALMGSQNIEIVYACGVFFTIPVLLCFFLGIRSLIDNLIRIME